MTSPAGPAPAQAGAAVDEDVAVDAVPEAGDLVDVDDVGVVPLRVGQRAGDDVLRHVVEQVGELALTTRPRRGEPLVRRPSEQQRAGRAHLVHLELVAFLAAFERERPAAPRVRLRTARVLDDPVDGDELRDHDLAHVSAPEVRGRLRATLSPPPRTGNRFYDVGIGFSCWSRPPGRRPRRCPPGRPRSRRTPGPRRRAPLLPDRAGRKCRP